MTHSAFVPQASEIQSMAVVAAAIKVVVLRIVVVGWLVVVLPIVVVVVTLLVVVRSVLVKAMVDVVAIGVVVGARMLIGDVDAPGIIEVEEVLVNVDVRPNDVAVELSDDMVVVRPEVL